jgi:undecaprenyl-diphosphatase
VSHPDLDALPLKVDPSSFPSAHTLIAFSIAFSLYMSGIKKAASWLLFLGVLIGLARVMAGVHYPSDIIGGILIALASSWYLHREASSIRKFLPND